MENVGVPRLSIKTLAALVISIVAIFGCASESVEPFLVHIDEVTGIEFVSVDRFSDEAATIIRRTDNANLPAPNEPIVFTTQISYVMH